MNVVGLTFAVAAASMAGMVSTSASSLSHGCLAVGHGATRVAATARPDDCCTGRMQCAQFLSTATVVKPASNGRI